MVEQGIFSSVMKDNKSTKPKNGPEVETGDARLSIEELSAIFSVANFPTDGEIAEKTTKDGDDMELEIGTFSFLLPFGTFLMI